MTVTFGYTIFYVEDVAATIRFYADAFGFSVRLLTPDNDYGADFAASNLESGGGFTRLDAAKPTGASITLLTDDVDSTVDLAVASGARHYVAAIDKPWGQRVAYVLDPNGILIEVATPVHP
jgi:lactoylglutathione lyase